MVFFGHKAEKSAVFIDHFVVRIPLGIDDIDWSRPDDLNDGRDIAVIIQVDIDRQFRFRLQEVCRLEKDAPMLRFLTSILTKFG